MSDQYSVCRSAQEFPTSFNVTGSSSSSSSGGGGSSRRLLQGSSAICAAVEGGHANIFCRLVS